MSTTTESAGLTTGTTEQTTTGSWELTAPARRPPAKTQRQASEAESAQRTKRAAEAAAAVGGQPGELVYQPGGPMGAGGHMLPPGQHQHHLQGFYPQHGQGGAAPPPAGAQQHAAPPAQMAPLPHLDLPHNPAGEARAHSPSPLDLFGDPFAGATNGQAGGDPGRGGSNGLHGLLEEDELLRIPSPPPLPAEWESAAARPGMLFDFDQFDINKRQQQVGAGAWVHRAVRLLPRALPPPASLPWLAGGWAPAPARPHPCALPSALLAALLCGPTPRPPCQLGTQTLAGGRRLGPAGDRDHRHEPGGCAQPLGRLHLADPVCGGERRGAQARHGCAPCNFFFVGREKGGSQPRAGGSE